MKSRDQFYVGRITDVKKKTVAMKFLNKTHKVPNQFDWLVNADILDNIELKGLFAGPFTLKGTCPFIIMGLDNANEASQRHINQVRD